MKSSELYRLEEYSAPDIFLVREFPGFCIDLMVFSFRQNNYSLPGGFTSFYFPLQSHETMTIQWYIPPELGFPPLGNRRNVRDMLPFSRFGISRDTRYSGLSFSSAAS